MALVLFAVAVLLYTPEPQTPLVSTPAAHEAPSLTFPGREVAGYFSSVKVTLPHGRLEYETTLYPKGVLGEVILGTRTGRTWTRMARMYPVWYGPAREEYEVFVSGTEPGAYLLETAEGPQALLDSSAESMAHYAARALEAATRGAAGTP